jgi:predicted nucleic acid-binding protein
MLAIDTNVYAIADADSAKREWLAAAIEASDEGVALSSVVLSELMMGQERAERRAELIRTLAAEVDILITPSHDDWLVAADAMRELGGHAGTKRRSSWNGVLIAASCARTNTTLLTANRGDFKRIRAVIPVETVAAF